MFYWDILTLEGRTDRLSENVGKELPLYAAHNPRRQQVSKLVQFYCLSDRRMPNGGIYICSVTLLQKMSNRVKSHDLPRQGIGPALSTQHCCSSFKSFFISKNHQTWGFHLLIPHKQNPHTKINQLAVTAKILSQPGIQLCVAPVAVQSWQTAFHGLHERLPWLVQHSCPVWTQIILARD